MTTNVSFVRKFLGASLLVLSVIISIAFLFDGSADAATEPFSTIGGHNRVWFFIWGAATGAAVYINFTIFAKRLDIKSRIFHVALVIAAVAAVVTTAVVGVETWERVVHVSSAMVFGILSVVCILFLLIVKIIRKNKRTSIPYIAILALVGIVFIFVSAEVGWFTAITQVVFINVSLLILFISNFIERWQPLENQAVVQLETEKESN
jgi:hypothetical protein